MDIIHNSKRFLPDKPLDGFYLPYLHSTVGCGFTGSPSLISQHLIIICIYICNNICSAVYLSIIFFLL